MPIASKEERLRRIARNEARLRREVKAANKGKVGKPFSSRLKGTRSESLAALGRATTGPPASKRKAAPKKKAASTDPVVFRDRKTQEESEFGFRRFKRDRSQ